LDVAPHVGERLAVLGQLGSNLRRMIHQSVQPTADALLDTWVRLLSSR
jgi:hypothetical protein